MKLLKLGSITINANRVLRFDDDGTSVSVSFLAPDAADFPVNVRFEGEEAEALRAWIAKQAKDLLRSVHRQQNKQDGKA